MRIRTVKPEFYQSEELATLPREDRLLAAALFNWADDDGYFRSHPALIAGALFPFDADARAFVIRGLAHLAGIGFVKLYENSIGWIPKFGKHQVISKHTESKLKEKAGPELPEDSRSTPVVLPEDSRTEVEVEVEQGSGRGPEKSSAKKPAALSAHQQTIDRLWATWGRLKRTPYAPAPKGADFKAVKELLAAGLTPESIDAAWARSLTHVGWPTISTVAELHQHVGKFTGPPRATGRGPADPSTQHHTEGRLDL